MNKVATLVHTWLVLDFFGDARRTGGASSSLTTTIFTQSFLALVFAALLYPETPPVPFAAANLCLSTLLVAVGAIGDDDQWNRRRADRSVLASAPVKARDLLMARCGHAAFYVCLVTIGMALPPAILLGFLQGDAWQVAGYVALACACSGLCTGTLAVAMHALDRAVGRLRAALLFGTGKAVLLGGGLALFALGMQQLQATADRLPIGRLGAELLLPYHGARLLADPLGEAWRVLPFAGVALLLLLLGVAIGEPEGDGPVASGRTSWLRRLLRRVARRGPRLAIAEFVAVSIWRSPSFRSRVLPLVGLPAGMVFLCLQGEGQKHGFVFACLLLQMPAIYLPFVIAFLPRAEQTDTGWVFEHAPPFSLDVVRDATWRALVVHVLLPVHALALAMMWVFGSARADATAASLFAFAVSVLAARPMLRSLTSVPFTQDRDAAAAIDLGVLFAAGLLLGGVGAAFGAFLSPAMRWATAVAALAAAVAALWRTSAASQPHLSEALPGPAGELEASPQVQAEERDEEPHEEPRAKTRATLGGELRAIGVLYAAVCVLPALVGTMFASG